MDLFDSKCPQQNRKFGCRSIWGQEASRSRATLA